MSNFSFLIADFPALHTDAVEAEQLTLLSPKAAAIFCRSTLENAINWLYDHDPKLSRPFKSELSALMHEHCFASQFNQTMLGELHLIRKTGNVAAHGNKVSQQDALASLKYLFRFLRYLVTYYDKQAPAPQVFDEGLIPSGKAQPESAEQIAVLQQQLAAKEQAAREAEQARLKHAEENAQLKAQLLQQQAELAARKQAREKAISFEQAVPLLVSEAETRRRYIDLSLKECGWDNLKEGADLEFEVTGMPASTNPTGKGYVDYVLWGDDGLPLAVVEAKKTMADAKKGKHQAELYANCLEAKTGQRPIIFYSNGFETHLWDDQFYPEREVQGFYSKEELQLLIARRQSRTDLREFKVNAEIAERAYQLEAIKRVAENFGATNKQGELRGRARQSLLVMATGSGKTRTAAAIVDMLTKCNWAKRVLFLADRNALVTQAKNAFNEYLPNLSAIDLTKEKEDNGTRLVFSTYPTIMNRIDNVSEGERFYGVGHFDLIIVDEAHRSVYQKYKAIFAYFDALLVGLTATPKTDIDHNTYGLFGIEDDNPTFAYELDSAVKEGFLVPPKAMSVPLKFIREGVSYHQLSDREKAEYEEKFGDPTTGEVPDEIDSAALNSWLFNTDTVDKVLAHLMQDGIHVQGGEKLGKTIIFAKNHTHAMFIEERFNKNYPEYGGKFLRVIDNYESKAQSLLETFVDKYEEKDPQIAVSVDMMDTGVDAPRVVNLVFFKQVKSATKFWQMIGRGTRLCLDLFGVGQHKTEFVIFDYCQNFEFFGVNPDGVKTKAIKSLTQQIFEAKLELAILVRERAESSDDERVLAEAYISDLQQTISTLDSARFVVKAKLRYVVEYSEKLRWQNLSKGDTLDINTHLSSLALPAKEDDELAKRFDILILNYQLALMTAAYSTDRFITQISGTAKALLKKQNIPAVAKQVHLLNELQVEQFWKTININRLENVRVSLRDLIKYLDKETQPIVETNFEDEIDFIGVKQHDLIPAYGRLQSYKDRVESYVRDHSNHLVIQKLKTNKPITETEVNTLETILFDGTTVGTKQDYVETYGDKPLGVFIRSIVGLDANSAQEVFAEFIQAGNLKADQMTFVNNIISYLTKNGMIDNAMLFEPPFTNIHQDGLVGVFDEASAKKVIQLVSAVNDNALVKVG
ncbi:DEAD/DEAH box helicase family protein [Methylophilus sp. Leaf414]|uniref:DEAD/DEAH box helicase family protein n=1 Tax=Methylophilus sp. Leaf414 TaxID=1736371 RepID=UPI0006F9BA00|nr:DEAD/DEAH box helicase family protein [Methylophilus sp. Leaf414]KQT36555.1 restriction endonuclease [Methylophilus sp. Leaf414]